ncbi:MAG TPA: hypothetical protein VMG10_32875 [Gemmataceae bacterium]|nr:hypothetical protein [Gemmataceae bacterium]
MSDTTHVLIRYRKIVVELIEAQLHLVHRVAARRQLPGRVVEEPYPHFVPNLSPGEEPPKRWVLDDIQERLDKSLLAIRELESLYEEVLKAGYRELGESPSCMGKILRRISRRCFKVLIFNVENGERQIDEGDGLAVVLPGLPSVTAVYYARVDRLLQALEPLDDMLLCLGESAAVASNTTEAAVDTIDLSILRALQQAFPSRLTLDRLALLTRWPHVPQRTLKERVPRLLLVGLVHRPAGRKGGVALTSDGRDLVNKAAKEN